MNVTNCNPPVRGKIAVAVAACVLIAIAMVTISGCTDQKQQADSLVRTAIEHSEADRYVDAVQLSGRAIALNPGLAEAFYLRGTCFTELQQPQKAVEDLSAATRLKPGWAEAWCALGIAQITSGETAVGVASLTKALQLNSKMLPAWEARARGYRDLHRKDAELRDIEELLQLDAANCGALLRRGTLLSGSNPTQAMEDFSNVISRDRNNAQAWMQRGLCYIRSGDTDRALADLNIACRLGATDFQSNNIDEAMSQVDVVLAAESTHADALRIRATLLAKLNRREEAIEGYTRLISSGAALTPEALAQSFLDRGRLHLEGNAWSAATEDLSKYLKVYPDHVDSLTLRARAFLAQNEAGKAVIDLTLVLLKTPDDAVLYTLRAEAFEQLNEPAAALADLQKAARLQPDDPAVHQKVAERLFQDRQFAKSAKTLDSLAVSNAGQLSAEQRLLRGRARLADGNLNGAYEDASALAAEESMSSDAVISEEVTLLQAMIALRRHDDLEALRLIKYVQEETLTPDAMLLYGQTLARQNQPDEAIRIFSNLSKSDPSNPAPLLARATVFNDTADWQAASHDAGAVLRSMPDDPRALQIKGNSLFQNDRFREALETLEHPALLSRDTNDSRWMRIQCCDELGLTYRELEELNALLGIAPTHEAARRLRAELLERLGHFDDAVSDLSALLQQNPANVKAMTDRAMLNQRRGNAAAAVVDFTTAIELSPQDAGLYYRRGIARHQVGQSDDARQDLNKAIELDSHLADAWYVIGNIEAGRGQAEVALAAYAKAVEIKPEHAAAWYNRGNLLFNQTKLHQAVDCWTIAITLQPELFRAYNNRAAAYDRMDQDTDAVADYEKTLQLNPGFVRAWDNLAWLLATSDNKKIRNPERAVKLATQACNLSEFKNWTCLNTLATCCAENQQFDAAVKWAKQAREIAPEADRTELDQLVAAYEARLKAKRIAGKPGVSAR